jgi:DNA modification methylase
VTPRQKAKPKVAPFAVEWWPISRPQRYPQNPRQNAAAVAKVAASIREFGWRQPLVVDEKGTIVAGDTRFLAALELGHAKVPVHVAKGLTPAQVRAYRIADNRVAQEAEWDPARLGLELRDLQGLDINLDLTGFDAAELDRLLEPGNGSAPGPDRDVAPPLPKKAITRPGDLLELGRHRVLCGDATRPEDVARLLEGITADTVITDPPYCSGGFQEAGRAAGSIGTDSKLKPRIANDTLSTRGYKTLVKAAIFNAGALTAYVFTDWRMWVNLFDVAEESGYGVRSMIVWDKGSPGMGMGWRAQHELVLFATRATIKFDNHKAVGNVVTPSRTGNLLHPTQKPVELIETILDVMDMVATVYDPFAGSGTTLVACEHAGRRCYAMELDPLYCDVTVERWEQVSGQKAVRPR